MGGYLPGEEEEFVYYLNLKGRNLFGRGQKAELLADQSAKNRTRFLIGYGQPLLATGFDFAYLQIGVRDFRDRFYEFAALLKYEFPVSEWFGLKGELGWKNVEPASEAARSFSVVTAGVGLDFGRIRHLRREQAFHSQWLFNYSGRRYRPADTGNVLEQAVFNDTRNEITIESQIPLGRLPAVYGRLLLQNVQTSEKPLPVSELFYFGGPGSLRGYRNEQFDAQRLALGNFEIRLFLSQADYLYPFIDGAYFEDYVRELDDAITKIEETRLGYGLGVVLVAGQRKLRMELAWGEGIAFDQPRIAVSLISGF
jgi:outer membrane protein assembly factor BamA